MSCLSLPPGGRAPGMCSCLWLLLSPDPQEPRGLSPPRCSRHGAGDHGLGGAPACGLTSKRCEFTFLPFLFQVTRGLGSPVAWHTKEATPPDTPIWSLGSLMNLGGSGIRQEERGAPVGSEAHGGIPRTTELSPTPPSHQGDTHAASRDPCSAPGPRAQQEG